MLLEKMEGGRSARVLGWGGEMGGRMGTTVISMRSTHAAVVLVFNGAMSTRPEDGDASRILSASGTPTRMRLPTVLWSASSTSTPTVG